MGGDGDGDGASRGAVGCAIGLEKCVYDVLMMVEMVCMRGYVKCTDRESSLAVCPPGVSDPLLRSVIAEGLSGVGQLRKGHGASDLLTDPDIGGEETQVRGPMAALRAFRGMIRDKER